MKKISCFFFFLLVAIFVSAQQDSTVSKLARYAKNISTFNKLYPQEKVYLHFDNTSYYLGESIWFKAYVVRADRNSLSQISKILYVDLLSAEGYVIQTLKLKVENGQCHGDFKLSTSNYGGFYEVRAYTRYMANFGEQNHFSRVFPVYDKPTVAGEYKTVITERANTKQIPSERPALLPNAKFNLTFYPEGGNLISGVTSRVAFKAFGKEGENAVISGVVLDAKGQKSCEIESGYLGMGVFEITPGTGIYSAKIEYDNKKYDLNLPVVLPTGYVMTVENTDSAEIVLQIQRNENTRGQLLGLSIACRGALYGLRTIDMKLDTITVISIPKSMLPSGVSQLTLYNSDGKIESERLVFVNHNNALKFQVSTNNATFKPFGKVNLDFELTDKNAMPIETNFSVAVRDAGTCAENTLADNAQTNLLLSSELQGYIEHPAYYFESNTPMRGKSLDLLMMTQGWKRYNWKQMARDSAFYVKQWTDKELTIDGTVSSLVQKKKLSNVDIKMLLLVGDAYQRGTCKTDSLGTFNFALQDFYGDAKLILRSIKGDKLRETNILLNRQFSPPIKAYSFAEQNVSQQFNTTGNSTLFKTQQADSTENYLPDGNDKLSMEKRQHLLKEVVVSEKRTTIKVNLSYNVEHEMDKILDTDDWQPATIDQLLQKLNKYYSAGFKGKNIVYIKTFSKGKTNVNSTNSNEIAPLIVSDNTQTTNSVTGVTTTASSASS